MKQYSKYKNSGIDWLGNIPEHWEVKRVKEIGNVVCGATPKDNAKNWDGDIIWISPADMDDFGEIKEGARTLTADGYNSCGTTLVPEGSIILSTRAPIGKTNIAVNTLCTNQGCKCIVFDKTKVDSRYFLYRFWSCNTQFQILGKGTTFFELSTKDLSLFYLSVPPYPEQTSIASYLDEKTANIDRRIELLRNKIDNYKQLRRSLISQVVTRGLNPDVKLKNSGIEWLGDVPEHWEVKRVKDVVVEPLKYGASESGVEFDVNLPRYIRITDITEDGKLKEDGKLSLLFEQAQNYILKDKSILFARSGASVGKTFLFDIAYGVSAFAGYLISAVPNLTLLNEKYFYLFCQSNRYWEWAKQNFTQATIQNISADKYSFMQIPIPPLTEQTAIAAYLDEKTAQIDSIIGKCEKQIEQLSALRRSLIAEAVTGKIKVC